jgi:hypothetical protein
VGCNRAQYTPHILPGKCFSLPVALHVWFPHFQQDSLDLAHQLCMQHGVFDRPLGLMGVWGAIVREWLDMLLPEDAADRYGG